jgi:hypothetical protein
MDDAWNEATGDYEPVCDFDGCDSFAMNCERYCSQHLCDDCRGPKPFDLAYCEVCTAKRAATVHNRVTMAEAFLVLAKDYATKDAAAKAAMAACDAAANEAGESPDELNATWVEVEAEVAANQSAKGVLEFARQAGETFKDDKGLG